MQHTLHSRWPISLADAEDHVINKAPEAEGIEASHKILVFFVSVREEKIDLSNNMLIEKQIKCA